MFVSVSTAPLIRWSSASILAILGFFVPSGGGKWLLEAPYVMQAANDLKVHLGWAVQVFTMPPRRCQNLINPFLDGCCRCSATRWACARTRPRRLHASCSCSLHLPLVLFLLWALAYTLEYHPPVVP